MGARLPLTEEDRAELRRRHEAGDRSMRCSFGVEDSPSWVEAMPDRGTLAVGLGDEITPAEARLLVIALLQAAEHVEFGPGEWRDGVFHRDEPLDGRCRCRSYFEQTGEHADVCPLSGA